MKTFEQSLSDIGEIGYIEKVSSSLAYAAGLPKARPFEVVVFESGDIGQVTQLSSQLVEILLFSKKKLRVGTRVARTGEFLSIAVGSELLGHRVDALGEAFDTKSSFKKPKTRLRVDVAPSGIVGRKLVTRPCETGITIVDLIVPLAKGQRELVIGDRKTGKTQFVLQALLTQARAGSICVFACIGKTRSHIQAVEQFFAKHRIEKNAVIVAASCVDAPGMVYLAPFTAMTIAEYFRDQGLDVMLVLDDLTTHAKFYREITLLGGRFPGRNSYPSDIFYTHARLLERAGCFTSKKAEVSITCLVVVETLLADITGYIQTNLMSITDGHIFLDSDLFYRGRRPSVHPFLSVTRLGRQTQGRVAHDINREIMSALSLSEKMQRFRRFGAELDEGAKLALVIGEYILNFFNQEEEMIFAKNVQIFSFALLWNGFWRERTIAQMKKDIEAINKRYGEDQAFAKRIDEVLGKAESLNNLLSTIGTQVPTILTV